MASSTLPVTGKFNTLIPYGLLGFATSDFVFKIMATPYVQINEAEGVTDGDQKYGYGGGAELGYKLFESVSLNVGYHYYTFAKGKNNSTGLSGSLANPVSLQFLTVGLSFPFNFNSIGSDYGGTSSRRYRGGR
jgi:opacity protein-like surface antigen